MTNAKRIVAFLRSLAPRSATNADIRERTGVKPHQQVFQITQNLMREGRIHGRQRGHEWEYWCDAIEHKPIAIQRGMEPIKPSARQLHAAGVYSLAASFEEAARQAASRHFGTFLPQGEVPGVAKKFDFVSADRLIVGDAKFYKLVGDERMPPAKFSVIAEHAWLLEKTKASRTFLVFGNDRRVPEWWLEKYGNLTGTLEFYFLSNDGKLDRLK